MATLRMFAEPVTADGDDGVKVVHQEYSTLDPRPLRFGSYQQEDKDPDFARRKAIQKAEGRTKAALKTTQQGAGRGVKIVRTYRMGEVPDIQIERRDVLEPLMACCRDSRFAAEVLLGQSVSQSAGRSCRQQCNRLHEKLLPHDQKSGTATVHCCFCGNLALHVAWHDRPLPDTSV